MKKIIILVFIFNFSGRTSLAQEMWGISNSNYAGNMGIFLNPSTIVAAPYKYDINLIALDVFAQNNYIYIPKREGILVNALFGNIGNEKIARDDFRGKRTKAFGHLLLIGPSYIRSKEQTGWGIHSAYRNEFSVLKAPAELSKMVYEEYNYQPAFGQRYRSDGFSAAWLGWLEVGGTYGKVFRESEKHYLKAAATVNLMVGMTGAYLKFDELEYTLQDTSTLIVHKLNATLAHSSSPTSTGTSGLFGFRGLGLGTTLGATYMHKRQSSGFECSRVADRVKKYDYRIGVSLMDLGLVHFFKNSSKTELQTSTDRIWNGIDSTDINNVNSLDTILSNRINGVQVSESKNFSMITPTAISIQFDYSITPRVYANLSWVNRIHFGANQVARGNQLDLSVRYEKRRWEVNGNISLFEYQRPAAGIGFRYAFFIIGTDRLLEWVNLSDVYTFDFFFGLKFNLCELSLRTRNPECPAFGSLN
ncbi:MAG TPA: DUF5723 family protein [Bacteroidia bacterium]|nr:DUF5723 family protein [Bacteroidia bacterium]